MSGNGEIDRIRNAIFHVFEQVVVGGVHVIGVIVLHPVFEGPAERLDFGTRTDPTRNQIEAPASPGRSRGCASMKRELLAAAASSGGHLRMPLAFHPGFA